MQCASGDSYSVVKVLDHFALHSCCWQSGTKDGHRRRVLDIEVLEVQQFIEYDLH